MSVQKGNILLPTISIIALIAIAAAGYFFWQTQQNVNNIIVVDDSNGFGSTPVPTTQDETANWQSYVNNSLKYSFKYPPEFNLIEESPDKVILTNQPNKPSIYFEHIQQMKDLPSEDAMSLEDFAKTRKNQSLGESDQTTIQKLNKFGLDTRFFEGVTLGYTHVYLTKPNPNLSFAITVVFPSKEEVLKYEPITNQILSTFRFTN